MWKIAIVDDDFQVLRGLKAIIPWEELDAEWSGEAIDGEQGLELVRSARPDIVLTDLYMPGISGIEMIEQLRAEGIESRFIILSGYSDFEYARQAIRLGVEDYLTKPGTVEQIREVLFRTIAALEETYARKLEQGELLESLQTYERLLAGERMVSFVNGTLKADEPGLELVAAKAGWTQQQHVTAIIEVLRKERIQGLSIADWNLFQFAVTNVVQELIQGEWPQADYVWLYGYQSAILLHAPVEMLQDAMTERAAALCRRIADCLQSYLGLQVRIGIGGVKQAWPELKASADEAFQALFYQEMRSPAGAGDAIAVYGTGQPDEAGTTPGPVRPDRVRFFQDLSGAMQDGSAEEMLDLILAYAGCRANPEEEAPPLYYPVVAAEIWAIFQYCTARTGLRMEEVDQQVVLYELDGITSCRLLEQWFSMKVRKLSLARKPAVSSKHQKTVETMIQYIHDHYAEDITLEDLAGQLYISKNYLNQLFKRMTGETFMNYVIRVRIEKAKALLLEGNDLIYEIAEKVGYQNVPYFSTLFKKYCGVNPSDLMKK
ncbi:response regulator transcription factor [Paenibacillus sp. y28]|uniref:response regulator transcription factor n=1 Tax=Paenibacillus sp. y28 TaxID=3129110 RepID=UPI0030180D7A